MVQSPSWEANWFVASQEIPRISRNPKVHYRTHKRPPPISILGPPNPVHTPTSHLLEIHPNIIHPSTPRSPQWSLSLRFPPQDPIHPPSPYPYAPHAQPISVFSIYHPHNIGWGVQFDIWILKKKICRENSCLTIITGTLLEDQCTFLLRMTYAWDKSCIENQNTHFIFSTVFPIFVAFMRYCGKMW